MSARKLSQTLTQGKLNFGSTKPRRTTTQNVKSKQTKTVVAPKKNIQSSDESLDVEDIEVLSSEDELAFELHEKDAVEDRKKHSSARKLAKRTFEPSAVLRRKDSAENQGAPELNENDPKYKSHYATVRKAMDYMPSIHCDGQGKIHEILRCFDMSYEFGPCVGISRLERWERAHLLGLNPPREVKDILTTKQGLEQKEFSQSVLFNEV
ncbi:DNA polymerase delta subunit 4 [Termitomyces sp. J132]|nr:hypothetical protein H2248_010920 [Termitomyces sp. 'cryptogamus']KNZ75167.1 DNA polymerase delta subunit 4 [Termitomyces sp. J132]